MTRRTLLLSLATAAALVGLGAAFFPSLAPATSLPTVLPPLVGGAAVVAGVGRAYRWLRRETTRTELPVRERGRPIAVPGDDFDRSLSGAPSAGTANGNRRALAVRRELESAAVDALVVYRGLSAEDARERLRDGSWTDDPLAAEFFTHAHGTGSSVTESVAGSFRDRGPFHRRARRAAAAIDSVVDRGGER